VTRIHPGDAQTGGPNPLFLREQALEQGIDLVYLAERSLSGELDRVASGGALSRTGCQALYLVARHPGLPVGRLRDALAVSKPHLARILKELADAGLVRSEAGPRDRRQRLMRATEKGRAAVEPLARAQRRRLAEAYRSAGAAAVEGFRAVLQHLGDARLLQALGHDDRP
jgi:DNA-binding MarR family transcriptional regulator